MKIGRNALASVAQVVVGSVIVFVLYRFILDTVGVDRLGIWSVVLAATSASRIGELGLSASVTRFVAKYRALSQDDQAGFSIQTAFLSIVLLLGISMLPAYVILEFVLGKIFSGEVLAEAISLLPYALVSFALTICAGICQSGLDGCQRYDWRAILVISGQISYLISAFWLAPGYGIVGLAMAQILQSVLLLVAGWTLLRRLLPELPFIPLRWQLSSFREMLGYGVQYQLGSIAMMLFDPLTKILLGKFGGLSSAGYYEMASQVVSRARALAVSANQVLVPVVAEIKEKNPSQLQELYRQNMRIQFFAAVPLFALVAAWSPVLSEVWIGQFEPRFVFFVTVLSLGWCLNTLCVPAYFFNQGNGRLLWNTLGLTLQGIANAIFGIVLGLQFGAAGIVWATVIALVVGATLIVVGFHRDNKFPWNFLFPSESIWIIVAGFAAFMPTFFIYDMMLGSIALDRVLVSIFVPLFLLAPTIWFHPLRETIRKQMIDMSSYGSSRDV